MLSERAVFIVGGAGLALAFLAALTKGGAATNAGALLGKAAGDATAGVIIGIGDSLGIPRTDESACAAAIREGRTYDASFACPAGTWLKYIFTPSTPPIVESPAKGACVECEIAGWADGVGNPGQIYTGPGGAAFGLYPKP